jgi:hypothetical protein
MLRFHGITPGFHNEAHRRAFEAARDAFISAGGPRRCASLAKHGGACGGWALRGRDHCTHHVAVSVGRERRLRLLSQAKTPAQVERAIRRDNARVQRIVWKVDRWAPGATVTLGPGEEAFEAGIAALGFQLGSLSPASADAARWGWSHVQAGRMTLEHLRGRVRWHVAKDAHGVG